MCWCPDHLFRSACNTHCKKLHTYIYIHTCAYAYVYTRIHMRIHDTAHTLKHHNWDLHSMPKCAFFTCSFFFGFLWVYLRVYVCACLSTPFLHGDKNKTHVCRPMMKYQKLPQNCCFSKISNLKPQNTHELSVSWVVCTRIFCIGVVCRFRHGRWTWTWCRDTWWRDIMNMVASDTGDEHGRCTPFSTLYVASRGSRYGVATVSRIDKFIGLFCRISSLL